MKKEYFYLPVYQSFMYNCLKLRNFPSLVKNMATVDAHGCILCSPHWRMPHGIAPYDGVYTYTAWASALLVLSDWAMRRPRSVGRATGKVPTLFSYIHAKTLIYQPP